MTPAQWQAAIRDLRERQTLAASRGIGTALRRSSKAVPSVADIANMQPSEIASAIQANLIGIKYTEGLDQEGRRISAKALVSIGDVSAAFIDHELVLDSPRSVKVLADGGTRLARLTTAEHRSVSSTVAKLRADGAHPSAIARRLRDLVPAGRWSSTTVRSKVIARTEVRFAQNVAAITVVEEAGLDMVAILDGQLPTSDDECRGRNGLEVTLDEAKALLAAEHPNGTMDFIPIAR